MPLVSIIIPTYNRGDILLDTIAQVINQNYENFELIIVDQTDNKKYDVSKKIKDMKNKKIKFYYVRPNSLTAARNFGMKKAKGEIIIYIDDDIKIKNNFIREHIKCHTKGVVAVAGKVKQKNHPKFNHIVFFDKYGFQHGLFNYTRAGEIGTFPGGNVSINRKLALKLGGFDTSFTGSAIREESEFAHRIGKYGKILYCPKAEIFHLAVPYGGCRINTQQYDNIEFYFNDFRFVFLTVKRSLIMLSLIKRFNRYALDRKRPTLVIKRTLLFLIGLAIALKRLIIPVKIYLKEISK